MLLPHHRRTFLSNPSRCLETLSSLCKNPAFCNVAIPEFLAVTHKPLAHIKSRVCPGSGPDTWNTPEEMVCVLSPPRDNLLEKRKCHGTDRRKLNIMHWQSTPHVFECICNINKWMESSMHVTVSVTVSVVTITHLPVTYWDPSDFVLGAGRCGLGRCVGWESDGWYMWETVLSSVTCYMFLFLPQLYSLLERINPDHNFPVRWVPLDFFFPFVFRSEDHIVK